MLSAGELVRLLVVVVEAGKQSMLVYSGVGHVATYLLAGWAGHLKTDASDLTDSSTYNGVDEGH